MLFPVSFFSKDVLDTRDPNKVIRLLAWICPKTNSHSSVRCVCRLQRKETKRRYLATIHGRDTEIREFREMHVFNVELIPAFYTMTRRFLDTYLHFGAMAQTRVENTKLCR